MNNPSIAKKQFHLDVAALLLAAYAAVVWITYLWTTIKIEGKPILLITGLVFLLSYFIMKWVAIKIRKIDLSTKKQLSSKAKKLVFVIPAIISFLILFAWFIAFYPGSYSPDSLEQVGQAISGQYNDWHPVWHTLVFFTLPIKLFGIPQIIVPIQILYFSLIVGYLSLTLSEMSNVKISFIFCSIIVLNPYTALILTYPWKCVGFAMTALLSTIMCIRLIAVQKGRTPPPHYPFIIHGTCDRKCDHLPA